MIRQNNYVSFNVVLISVLISISNYLTNERKPIIGIFEKMSVLVEAETVVDMEYYDRF